MYVGFLKPPKRWPARGCSCGMASALVNLVQSSDYGRTLSLYSAHKWRGSRTRPSSPTPLVPLAC